MSIALHETRSSGRGVPDFSRIVAALRLCLGVIAVLALLGFAALGQGAVSAPVEPGGNVTATDNETPLFDGRGKWGGY